MTLIEQERAAILAQEPVLWPAASGPAYEAYAELEARFVALERERERDGDPTR